MCLAIPMKVIEIDRFTARCEAKGVERDVSLFMLQDETVAIGDYLVVNLGYAIQKVSQTEAMAAWEIYDEMIQLSDQVQEKTLPDNKPRE